MVNVVQSAYQERMDPGRAGIVVGVDWNADTGNCETAAGLAFGIAVSQGAADKGVVIGGAVAGFRGITIRDITLESRQLDKYARYQNVGVLTRGKIWAAPAVAVAAGDPVHYSTTTGILTNTGGVGPITGARWVTAAAGTGDLALVELSGFNQ